MINYRLGVLEMVRREHPWGRDKQLGPTHAGSILYCFIVTLSVGHWAPLLNLQVFDHCVRRPGKVIDIPSLAVLLSSVDHQAISRSLHLNITVICLSLDGLVSNHRNLHGM